jgi:hypothetical protein
MFLLVQKFNIVFKNNVLDFCSIDFLQVKTYINPYPANVDKMVGSCQC